MKIHIKVNDKAVCGQKERKNPLKFATEENTANCQRCKKVVAK